MVFTKIFGITNLSVLGVFRENNEEDYAFSLLNLINKNDQLIVTSKYVFDTIEDVLAKIDNRLPLIVVFDGKGILYKKIDYNLEQDLIWKSNIDFNTIYNTSYIYDNIEFISFARKTLIDGFLDSISKKNIQVIDVYIGSLVSVVLKDTLNKASYVSNTTVLKFSDTKLVEIEKISNDILPPQYNISGSEFSGSELLLYSSAINYFVRFEAIEKNISKTEEAAEFIYKRAFNILSVAILASVLLLLLASYSFTQYFISENALLNEQNIYSSHTIDEMKKMEIEKQQKLKILSETGQLSKKFLSFYIYVIVKSIPVEINLTSIEILPLSNDIKEGKRIEVDANTILISGISNNDESFNNWMKELKEIKWIRTFEILSIKKNKENRQDFDIKIHLNNV